MSRTLTFGLLLAVIAALALRCPQLGIRAMHNDEAVNSIKLRDLWQRNFYRYDPHEYHGPTLIYATLVCVKLLGAPDFVQTTESELRTVTVIFGVALILLLPLVADGLGRNATIAAAFLIAISPAMVFYSRYFIHEMLLVFFSALALAAAWRYTRNPKLGWALLAGVAVGLMQATKETFVLTIGALVAALVCQRVWNRLQNGAETSRKSVPLNFKHLAAALAMWVVVAVVLFTSFFTNAQGPLDAVRTYLPWLHRVEGASPHIHPWYFYFERLLYFHSGRGPVWSEGFIFLLAIIGTIAAFTRKTFTEGNAAFIRFLAFFTFILTAIYCVIGYKTPWCLLNFWYGMILLAGVGVIALLNCLPNRILKTVAAILIFAAAGQLAFQAWRAAIPYASDRRNPYVYAQTSDDILNLVERVKVLASESPRKNETIIKVMSPESDFWPLPWYLRQFAHVGWWGQVPADPYAPIMIVSAKFDANLDAQKNYVMAGLFELRPGAFFELYVQSDLWRAHLNAALAAPSPP